MGVFLIAFGAVGVVIGIFGETFYSADVNALNAFSEKSSKWSGRLVFIAGGSFLIAVGIKLLLDGQ